MKLIPSKKSKSDDDCQVERGLHRSMSFFIRGNARPSNSNGNEKSMKKTLCLVVISSLVFMSLAVGIVIGVLFGKSDNTDDSVTKLHLHDLCDITYLGDINRKKACIEECRAAMCCFSVEINNALEQGGQQALELEHLIAESHTGDDNCNVDYGEMCQLYEPCLNILVGAVNNSKTVEESEEMVEEVFIHELCKFELVSTKEGRLQCHNACKMGSCCFDENKDCTIEIEKQCDDYKPCAILDVFDEAKNEDLAKSINNTCSDESTILCDRRILCNDLCKPGNCCFNDENCVDIHGIKDIPERAYCMPFSNCAILYNQSGDDDAEVCLAELVNATCSKISTAGGRKECEDLCMYHRCCVDPQAELGCSTGDDVAYCSDHLGCVASFQPFTSDAPNEDDNENYPVTSATFNNEENYDVKLRPVNTSKKNPP